MSDRSASPFDGLTPELPSPPGLRRNPDLGAWAAGGILAVFAVGLLSVSFAPPAVAVALILLTGLAITVGGVLRWKSRERTLLAERRRAVDSAREAAVADAFEAEVRRRLSDGPDGFDLFALADQSGVPREIARSVGIRIYASVLRRTLTSGAPTPQQQARLSRLAAVMGIQTTAKSEIDRNAATDVYREAVRQLPRTGAWSESYEGRLDALRRRFNLTQQDAYEALRSEAEGEYRTLFAAIIGQEDVTTADVARLDDAARLFGLPESWCGPHLRRVRWLAYLTDCRHGRAPTVATRKMLDGGEICHYEGGCVYRWMTASKQHELQGELTVTTADFSAV